LKRTGATEPKRWLIEDVRDADIIDLTAAVTVSAIRILETTPVPALYALHVACAVEWGAELFASSDDRQLKAAEQAGLKTRQL
jgi:uncharacterized protein